LNFLEIREPRVKYDWTPVRFSRRVLSQLAQTTGAFGLPVFGRRNLDETVRLPVDCNRSSRGPVDVCQQYIKFDLTSVRLLRSTVVVRSVTGDGSTAGLEG